MIVDAAGQVAVSCRGWVDRGSLWLCHTDDGSVESVPVGDFEHLELHAGTHDHFAVVPHRAGPRAEVSVRRFSDPGHALATLVAEDGVARFGGDPSAWLHVPRAYRVQPSDAAGYGIYALLLIHAGVERVEAELQPLDWYSQGDYDHGYQALLAPVEDPDRPLLVFGVQRDSTPVVYDWLERKVVGRLALAGRQGSPEPRFRPGTRELWAMDYDTLTYLRASDWAPLGALRLGQKGFCGPPAFTGDGGSVVVARPFDADVVVIDAERLQYTARVVVGGQPLDAVLVAGGRLVARDWKSGALLRGALR